MPAPMDIEDAASAARRSPGEEKKGLRPVVLGLLAVAFLGVVIVIAWSIFSGGGTPTTPTTPKVTATTGKLVVTSKVVGVDYQKLIGDAALKSKFEEVVIGKYILVIRTSIFSDILPKDVALELRAGLKKNSVIVQATINWNGPAIAAARLATIFFGDAFHKDLATKIAEVAGEAKSGEVTAEMVSISVQPKDDSTSGGDAKEPTKDGTTDDGSKPKPTTPEEQAAELKAEFERVANRFERVAHRLEHTDEDSLKIYALYKQATVGDWQEGGVYGRFDAWKACEGMSTEDAMKKYISEAKRQILEYGITEVEDPKKVMV